MIVEPTLEVRWFLPGPIPPEAQAWFDALGPPASAESRTDRYLIPTDSSDLGLKIREGCVQAKQRTGALGLRAMAAGGRVEAWRKWTLGSADESPEAGWVDVAKTRWQRTAKLLGRDARCAVELSELTVEGERWWSVCLEASGSASGERWRVLRASARHWRLGVLSLPPETSEGYPAWLPGAVR